MMSDIARKFRLQQSRACDLVSFWHFFRIFFLRKQKKIFNRKMTVMKDSKSSGKYWWRECSVTRYWWSWTSLLHYVSGAVPRRPTRSAGHKSHRSKQNASLGGVCHHKFTKYTWNQGCHQLNVHNRRCPWTIVFAPFWGRLCKLFLHNTLQIWRLHSRIFAI